MKKLQIWKKWLLVSMAIIVPITIILFVFLSIDIPIDRSCNQDSDCSLADLRLCGTCGGNSKAYNTQKFSFKLAETQYKLEKFVINSITQYPCPFVMCEFTPLIDYASCENNVCVKKTKVSCNIICESYVESAREAALKEYDPEKTCDCY